MVLRIEVQNLLTIKHLQIQLTKKHIQLKKEEKKTSFWEEIFASKKKTINLLKKARIFIQMLRYQFLRHVSGTTKIINMLQTQICPKCGGRKFVNGSVCSCCKGKGETSTYKRFNVKIPAGIKDKSKIRLAEEGERGQNGGRNGDLYLTIHIREPKGYKTDGLNILKTIQIAPYEAVLGGEVTVSTLIGNVAFKDFAKYQKRTENTFIRMRN